MDDTLRDTGQTAYQRCDFHAFEPGLYVGAAYPCEAAPCLASVYGVSAVVDLRDEACDDADALASHGVELLHLPTPDLEPVSPAMLARGVAFAAPRLDAGETVLIHCQHGIGRSALLALCVMVARGMAPLEALERAKDRRGVVSPSPQQFEGWRGWLDDYARSVRPAWTAPTFDEFAAIAYRHLRQG